MRLKLYRAPRMAEAMAQVRAELGAEATILSTRRVTGGVEVTAALESEEPILFPPDAPSAAPLMLDGPLALHGLPPWLAPKLAGTALEQRVAELLAFAELPGGLGRPLLLVGPPGAGKTLTCAKLATRAVLRGAAPLVVTTDAQRAGAAEQLAAFTRVLGLTMALATGPGALAKALARRAQGAPALIDTAGCDPFDPAQREMLRHLADAAQADPVLVLPAGLDPEEAADLARAFAALGARHLVPTRLDLARRLGGVLAAAAAGGLALTEGGTGAGAIDGLTPLTPALIAERLSRPMPQHAQPEAR
jgi:flagellar biosynthesis protein FlhF